MLSVVMPSVACFIVMLSVIMLKVVVLNVVMPSVIMLYCETFYNSNLLRIIIS